MNLDLPSSSSKRQNSTNQKKKSYKPRKSNIRTQENQTQKNHKWILYKTKSIHIYQHKPSSTIPTQSKIKIKKILEFRFGIIFNKNTKEHRPRLNIRTQTQIF